MSKGPSTCSSLCTSEIFKLWSKIIMNFLNLFNAKGKDTEE
jgi:hypothetical protein